MATLYEQWLGSEELWNKTSLVQELQSRTVHEKKGCNRWMTRAQIEEKYHSAKVAQEIVDNKTNDPALSRTHVMQHPDAPDNKVPRPTLHASISFQGPHIVPGVGCLFGNL